MILHSSTIPHYVKFVIGGSSGLITTLVLQPFDFIKIRMQITGQDGYRKSYKNSLEALKQIVHMEGFMAIYAGLSAALFRQATYTSAKFGIFTMLYEKLTLNNKPPQLLAQVLIGILSGIIASCIGTPSEIALIRMTADGALPLEQKRNYRHVFHAFACIVEEDGILGLWKSVLPTLVRGVVASMIQLVSYSQAKEMLIKQEKWHEGIMVHFISSMISGLNTSIISLPVDIIKTRMQNMQIVNGIPEYSSSWNVFHRIYMNEGVRSLWKGFVPYFLKIGSQTVIMFVIFEQISAAYVFLTSTQKL